MAFVSVMQSLLACYQVHRGREYYWFEHENEHSYKQLSHGGYDVVSG
jgi:hypothetical protein